jgi:hypothetical protein
VCHVSGFGYFNVAPADLQLHLVKQCVGRFDAIGSVSDGIDVMTSAMCRWREATLVSCVAHPTPLRMPQQLRHQLRAALVSEFAEDVGYVRVDRLGGDAQAGGGGARVESLEEQARDAQLHVGEAALPLVRLLR